MKNVLLILLLAFSLTTIAQTEKAFFSKDSAGISNIANMVAETTVNKYQLEKTIPKRDYVEFWFRASDHSLLTILFKFFPDRSAVLAHIDGKFEDVFPFWKKYFQPAADQQTLESNHKSEEINTPFLNGTAIFVFRRLANPMWQLSTLYKVTPVQPETGSNPAQKKDKNAPRP